MARRKPVCCKKCGVTHVDEEGQRCVECVDLFGVTSEHLAATKRAAGLKIKREKERKRLADLKTSGTCRVGTCEENVQEGKNYCPEHQQQFLKKSSTKNKARTVKTKAENLCWRCGEPAEEGSRACKECIEPERERGRIKDTKKRDLKRATDTCYTCPSPAAPGHTYCDPCLKAQSGYGKIYRERQKEDGLCEKCNNPVAEGTKLCEEHREKRRIYHSLPYVVARDRGNMQARKLERDGLPRPSISIFEALDLKKEYLAPILAKISFPDPDDFYVDSEICTLKGNTNAANVFEWTGMTAEPERQEWCELRHTYKQEVPEEKLARWALELFDWADQRVVVFYGNARPEANRLKSLWEYLPEDKPAPTYTTFEPQNDLFRKLFSRDPEDELDPDALIYAPDWSIDVIYKSLNSATMPDGSVEEYCTWKWRVRKEKVPLEGKSVEDVVFLYCAVEAFRLAKAGQVFGGGPPPSVLKVLAPRSPAKSPQKKLKFM